MITTGTAPITVPEVIISGEYFSSSSSYIIHVSKPFFFNSTVEASEHLSALVTFSGYSYSAYSPTTDLESSDILLKSSVAVSEGSVITTDSVIPYTVATAHVVQTETETETENISILVTGITNTMPSFDNFQHQLSLIHI